MRAWSLGGSVVPVKWLAARAEGLTRGAVYAYHTFVDKYMLKFSGCGHLQWKAAFVALFSLETIQIGRNHFYDLSRSVAVVRYLNCGRILKLRGLVSSFTVCTRWMYT